MISTTTLLRPGLPLGNFEGLPGAVKVPNPVEERSRITDDESTSANVIDPSLTIAWLKSITKMEIWTKEILTGDGAEAAIAAEVDGLWLPNHGRCQLDSTIPAIETLAEVVDSVRGRVPFHIDGGVRRGNDIVKALAVGADFVWIAKPALWGLKYD